jgi:hypothetical protein
VTEQGEVLAGTGCRHIEQSPVLLASPVPAQESDKVIKLTTLAAPWPGRQNNPVLALDHDGRKSEQARILSAGSMA